MLIIVYNCNSDWMPAMIYLQISGYAHACKQASRSAVQVGTDLANR
jgi:hypothetical protein